jgi:hypothetical protein
MRKRTINPTLQAVDVKIVVALTRNYFTTMATIITSIKQPMTQQF